MRVLKRAKGIRRRFEPFCLDQPGEPEKPRYPICRPNDLTRLRTYLGISPKFNFNYDIRLIMTPELEEFLHNTFKLRQTLSQVLPKEAVDYLMELIVKDSAHRKYLELTKD